MEASQPGYPELDPAFEFLRKDPHVSITMCNNYLKKHPDCRRAYMIIQMAHRRLGNLQESHKAVEEYIRLRPDGALAYQTRGEIKYEMDQFENAILDAEQAKALDSNKILGSLAHRLIALCHARMGNTAAALEAADSIEELYPNEWFPPIGPLPAGTKPQFRETIRRMAEAQSQTE